MADSERPGPLLVVVEGANDGEFLLRLTAQLRRDQPNLPDLHSLVAAGRIAVIPVGGGDPASWPDRLAALGLPEFHLYDREQAPEDEHRVQAIERVNARHGCSGFLTSKRSLENYLHPAAIAVAGGGAIEFGDQVPVARLLAHHWQAAVPTAIAWEVLAHRTQRRQTHHAKRWLNTVAVEHMTLALLVERDPAGELLSWLRTIQELAGTIRS